MAFSDDDLRTYQQQAVRAIAEADEDYKSLILPTGAGKTRVGLAYASRILDKEGSVAYITQTDAHVGQVLSEADEIGVDAVHIPGRSAESQGDGGRGDREIDIQDYNIGFKIGVFSYAGYFLEVRFQLLTLLLLTMHMPLQANISPIPLLSSTVTTGGDNMTDCLI